MIATRWVGLILGVPQAIAARAGRQFALSAASLIRPILCLLLVMGICATLAGLAGVALASGGLVFLVGDIALRISPARHARFLVDLWAHNAK